jgi:hypothetical protein
MGERRKKIKTKRYGSSSLCYRDRASPAVAEKRAATARDVGEGELDGARQKRVRRLVSSTSRHPFLQRRPDAGAPLRAQNLAGIDVYY